MKMQRILTAALVLGFNVAAASAAFAVTVEINVESKGEPIPGTTITFETPDGEDVPVIKVTSVTSGTANTTTSTDGTATDVPQADQPQSDAQVATLDDSVLGKDVVAVVHKDGEVIKRQAVRVGDAATSLKVEAFDPRDANLSLALSQPKPCRWRKTCTYDLSVTNKGDGIYKGPLFLSGILYGRQASNDAGLTCSDVGRGEQICHLAVSIEPGETENWSLPVTLPNYRPPSANCLAISRLAMGPGARRDPVVQAIQHGLNVAGFAVGRSDGIIGPRTRSAIAAWSTQHEIAEGTDLPGIYRALFNQDLDGLARLGLSHPSDCATVALVGVPRIVRSTPRRPPPEVDTGRRHDPSISIGIGIGVFGGRHGRRRFEE